MSRPPVSRFDVGVPFPGGSGPLEGPDVGELDVGKSIHTINENRGGPSDVLTLEGLTSSTLIVIVLLFVIVVNNL